MLSELLISPNFGVHITLRLSLFLEQSQIVEEDQQQHRRADVAQQEDEYAVDAEFQLSVVRNLPFEHLLVEPPADEDAGEESACGQQDVGREEVERIEDAEPEDPPAVQQAQRQRCHGGQRHAGSGRGPCGGPPAHVPLLVEVGRDDFV